MSRTKFRERIRAALANEPLQVALDANAERRVNGRIAAFASLPDSRERRQQAHAVRVEVIEHLEDYLEQFIDKATENGITVHRAKDAGEAIELIFKVTESNVEPNEGASRRRLTPLIAKSKSMVSEENNLNNALE